MKWQLEWHLWYDIYNVGIKITLFKKKPEPVQEKVEREDDEIREEDLENVIAGVPYEFAKEKISELEQMLREGETKEETESKQK